MPGAMARRIPKPFTVEVRKSGRKPAAAMLDPALTPAENDQPRITWPGLDTAAVLSTSGLTAAAAPCITGRILPALEEAAAIEPAPETERRPRTRRQSPPAMPDHAPAATAPDRLEAVADDVEPDPTIAEAPAADAMAAAAAGLHRLKRLSRDEFKRGERWKARLPAAAHRRQR